MSGSNSTTGPYFTPDGRSYFIINGERVSGFSGRGAQSSARDSNSNRAPSVVSKYESKQLPPKPTHKKSYPPLTDPSGIKTRMTTGFPKSRFNVGTSQGSAPASDHHHLDPYRNAADKDHNKTGPPLDSQFVQTYNTYKELDAGAEGAEDQYKEYLGAARKVTKKMRNKNPGGFVGQPLETREWHQTAAEYAARGRDQANR